MGVYMGAEVLILLFPLVLYGLWQQRQPHQQWRQARKAVVLALVSVTAALACKSLVTLLITRPRPYLSHPDLVFLPLRVDPQSFPSGHTLVAFTLASSLFLSGYKRLGGGMLAVAGVIAFSRVAAGVHYPSDVLAGIILAVLVTAYLHRESSTLKQYLP
jgi:undecaprenyl-diphosphatase